jgi:hypothetical protein
MKGKKHNLTYKLISMSMYLAAYLKDIVKE